MDKITCPICGKGFNSRSTRVIEGLEDQVEIYHAKCYMDTMERSYDETKMDN